MKKMKLLLLCLMTSIMGAKAQIGYQISLLNTATGEPRANENVTVGVSLSNSKGEVFFTETKSATTNDFGVLSLSIGNADTFKNVDLSQMPFFIEVTANSVAIGKSQILSVPVAEVAKTVKPIDKSLIVGTWVAYDSGATKYKHILEFKDDGTGQYTDYLYVDNTWDKYDSRCFSFTWLIDGSCVHLIYFPPTTSGDGTYYDYQLSQTLYFTNGMLLNGLVYTKQ